MKKDKILIYFNLLEIKNIKYNIMIKNFSLIDFYYCNKYFYKKYIK